MSVCETMQVAIHDIAAERLRQIESEGWTAEHDDAHGRGQMALASACYAMFASVSDRARAATTLPASLTVAGKDIPGWSAWLEIWPWDRKWWKPKDRRSDLVRAGALIVAEIERLDRQAARKAAEQSQEPEADEDEGYGSGPYTCMRCLAGTSNDDDVCDDCAAEAAEQSQEEGG